MMRYRLICIGFSSLPSWRFPSPLGNLPLHSMYYIAPICEHSFAPQTPLTFEFWPIRISGKYLMPVRLENGSQRHWNAIQMCTVLLKVHRRHKCAPGLVWYGASITRQRNISSIHMCQVLLKVHVSNSRVEKIWLYFFVRQGISMRDKKSFYLSSLFQYAF